MLDPGMEPHLLYVGFKGGARPRADVIETQKPEPILDTVMQDSAAL